MEDNLTREQFKNWGKQGGVKGGLKKGKSKVRGDSEYYRNIARKRKQKEEA
jgi:hypothetical protein